MAKQMIREVIKTVYLKFGYFLMILLGLGIIINGTSQINGLISWSILITMILAELFIFVLVEFNEGEETFTIRFFRRFTRLDVLGVCLLIIFYIGGCNGWLDMVY